MKEIVVCTIITKNYIAYARTLASTLAAHNPNSKLFVLLADRIDGYFTPSVEPFHLIHLEDLPDQQAIEKMCFYYTPFELCCALRGMLHEYMFEKTSSKSWIFLDSDIMIFNSLDIIFNQLEQTSILLNPHSTTPVNIKHVEPHEVDLLRSGLYNAGFLGLRRTDESRAFISWFKERLTSFCFQDYDQSNGGIPSRGLFVDQLWLNLVILYFTDICFCLNPGANLGQWNLFERHLKKNFSGKITVNDQPILFVHFSGWDINNPTKVSKYAPMYEKTPPFWIELSEAYREKLLQSGYEEVISYPYAFNYFQSGEPITSAMRRIYYNELMQGTAFESSPFLNSSYFKLKCYPKKTMNYQSLIQRLRGRISKKNVIFF